MNAWRAALALLIVCAVFIGFQNCELDSPSGMANLNSQGEMQEPDTAPPDLVINRAPPAVTAAASTVFEFASTDPSAVFECALDGAAFAACTSPKSYGPLASGEHGFAVRARDPAGNLSDQKTHAWRIDPQALSVSILTSIPAFTNQRSFSIAFQALNPQVSVAAFECKLNALDYAACSSPYVLTNLVQGNYTLQIRARDSLGNYSSPSALVWNVDLSAPLVVINSGPSGAVNIGATTTALATFTFNVQDAGDSQVKTVTCKLDAGAEAACANSVSYQVNGDGAQHTLTIRATDNAGNSATATRTFSYYWDYPQPDPSPGGDGGE